MEPIVVFEDEHASIVYGLNSVTLGHLKIFPKQKANTLDELPTKTIAHLFSLATRCGSLLFDGLQAQGTNIILNEGKNANMQGDNICIDVIARSEKDELSFVWQPKQGDIEQVKQIAGEISGKVIIYEKPIEAKIVPKQKVVEKTEAYSEPITIKVEPSPEEFGLDPVKNIETTPNDAPKNEESLSLVPKDTSHVSAAKPVLKTKEEVDFDKKTNFLYYELLRMP